MASVGKGGGKRKVFWTATCNRGRHGAKGFKSTASTWFVNVAAPRIRRRTKHQGCPQCRAEAKRGVV